MTTNKFWTLITVILIVIIIVGCVIARARYSGSQPIEIALPPPQEPPGEIYIGGAVNNAGFYPLQVGDSIEALMQAAGGITSSADLTQLKLYIPEAGKEAKTQKVNINQAELWLLEALPGIGQIRAQAIIDYRQQNGLFHNITELTKVDGVGTTTYQQIKHLITVAD